MTELLDVAQACDYLGGIHRATLSRIVKAGELTPVRIGKHTMYDQADLERYIDAHTLLATAAAYVPEPELPGRWTLYRFYAESGDLLYIGITGQGANRWTHHSKYQPWWTEVATIRVEHHDSLDAVAAAEAEAIIAERPRYNVKGQPR
jgi:excisionase family DNA binding protein